MLLLLLNDVVVGDFFFQFFLLSLRASKNVPRVTQMQFGSILHHYERFVQL